MITQFKKWLICASLIGAVALVDSCKKVETTPPNPVTPVVTQTNDPDGPSFKNIDVFPATATFVVGTNVTISFDAVAASGTKITKVTRNDGITGDTLLFKDAAGSSSTNSTIDIYFVPKTQGGKTISMVYTVWDSSTTSHKVAKNTLTRKLEIVPVPKIYKNNWVATIGDQTYQQGFINTGGIPGNASPQVFATGDLSDTAKRSSVDIVCANLLSHNGVFLASPSCRSLDSIPAYFMTTWTLKQRKVTTFKRLPDGVDVVSSFKTADAIKTKYDAIAKGSDVVQPSFPVTASYCFKTADGRYGAFTVQAKGTNAVKFSLAVESR